MNRQLKVKGHLNAFSHNRAVFCRGLVWSAYNEIKNTIGLFLAFRQSSAQGHQSFKLLTCLLSVCQSVSLEARLLGSITSVAGNAQVGCWLNLSSSGLRKWEKLNRVITQKDGREDVLWHWNCLWIFLLLSHVLLFGVHFLRLDTKPTSGLSKQK